MIRGVIVDPGEATGAINRKLGGKAWKLSERT